MKVNRNFECDQSGEERSRFQERAGEKVEAHSRMEDVISVENRAASRPGAQNVEEAGELLSQVMNNIESAAPSVHNLDQYRISQLFS